MARPDIDTYQEINGSRQNRVNQIVADFLIANLSRKKSRTYNILDPCCGPLGSAHSFNRQVNWFGADLEPAFLSQHSHSTLTAADCANLPFPDSYFDGCALVYALKNHVNMKGSVQELIRVTKPTGLIAVCEPGFGLREIQTGHVNLPQIPNEGINEYHHQTAVNIDHFYTLHNYFTVYGAQLTHAAIFIAQKTRTGKTEASKPVILQPHMSKLTDSYRTLRQQRKTPGLDDSYNLRHILPIMLFQIA